MRRPTPDCGGQNLDRRCSYLLLTDALLLRSVARKKVRVEMTDWPHSREPGAQSPSTYDWQGAGVARDQRGASPARLGWLIVWMSGTLLSFIVAALSVGALSTQFSAFEMMSVRSAGGL